MPVTACEFESHPAHIVRFTSKGIPKRNALFFVLSAKPLDVAENLVRGKRFGEFLCFVYFLLV